MNATSLRRGAVMLGVVVGVGLLSALVIVREANYPRGTVWPLLAQAVAVGLLNAMFAVGLVLVYRASRVINFAHGGFWIVG